MEQQPKITVDLVHCNLKIVLLVTVSFPLGLEKWYSILHPDLYHLRVVWVWPCLQNKI